MFEVNEMKDIKCQVFLGVEKELPYVEVVDKKDDAFMEIRSDKEGKIDFIIYKNDNNIGSSH